METITVNSNGNSIMFAVQPDACAWDATQMSNYYDKNNREIGRGDYETAEGYRVLASTKRLANMIGRRLAKEGISPR